MRRYRERGGSAPSFRGCWNNAAFPRDGKTGHFVATVKVAHFDVTGKANTRETKERSEELRVAL
jgi:hypothetical protein